MTENDFNYSAEDQMRGLIEQLDAYINQYHGGSVELVSFDGKNSQSAPGRILPGLSTFSRHAARLGGRHRAPVLP